MRITGDDGIDPGTELDLEPAGNLVRMVLDTPRPQIQESGELVASFTMTPAQARAAATELRSLAAQAEQRATT